MINSCLTCGSIKSNSNISINFPRSMMVAMIHAVNLERVTEMMCGNDTNIEDGLKEIQDQIKSYLGKSHEYFDDRKWTKLMIAVSNGISSEIVIIQKSYWRDKYQVQVEFDDIVISTDSFKEYSLKEAESIVDYLIDDIEKVKPLCQ